MAKQKGGRVRLIVEKVANNLDLGTKNLDDYRKKIERDTLKVLDEVIAGLQAQRKEMRLFVGDLKAESNANRKVAGQLYSLLGKHGKK